MDDSLDLQTTYRAILDAARQGKYVSYGALAEANGAEWAKVRYKLNSQLGDIMELAAERGWPIPSAIVVDKANLETGTLSDSAVKGFVGAARDLGFDVRDPQAFIAEQQRAMFAWAKGAPDELGPAAKPYLDRPLNTILYGPPGTGKTYATFRRCVEICDRSAAGKEDDEIHARYRELVEEGRVEFVTFHQSYGYEEFVEGLRPESGGDAGGFRLDVRDGVLKRIAKRARSAPTPESRERRFFKVELGEQDVLEECIENGMVRFHWHTNPEDQDWSDSKYDSRSAMDSRIKELYPNDFPSSLRWINYSSAVTFRCRIKQGDIVVAAVGRWNYQALGEVVGDYEYDPSHPWPHQLAVRWYWKAEKGRSANATDFQDQRFATYRVHQLYPERPDVLLQHLQQDPQRQPYVLVIDEINRANIAKVLGELITLLEEDKREGAENELAVTLPHSNERFTLPKNLHLLGTMNTADRSIALLDTALRRRFVFEEITPEPALLEEAGESAGVDLPAVLRAMNDRLEWLVGRDHLIGHAWFLKANSREAVDEVMRRKVIPLIAEYFYDDWEKVRAVLGGTDAFVQGEKLEPPPGLDGGGEKRYRWTVREAFPVGAYEELIAGEES